MKYLSTLIEFISTNFTADKIINFWAWGSNPAYHYPGRMVDRINCLSGSNLHQRPTPPLTCATTPATRAMRPDTKKLWRKERNTYTTSVCSRLNPETPQPTTYLNLQWNERITSKSWTMRSRRAQKTMVQWKPTGKYSSDRRVEAQRLYNLQRGEEEGAPSVVRGDTSTNTNHRLPPTQNHHQIMLHLLLHMTRGTGRRAI